MLQYGRFFKLTIKSVKCKGGLTRLTFFFSTAPHIAHRGAVGVLLVKEVYNGTRRLNPKLLSFYGEKRLCKTLYKVLCCAQIYRKFINIPFPDQFGTSGSEFGEAQTQFGKIETELD